MARPSYVVGCKSFLYSHYYPVFYHFRVSLNFFLYDHREPVFSITSVWTQAELYLVLTYDAEVCYIVRNNILALRACFSGGICLESSVEVREGAVIFVGELPSIVVYVDQHRFLFITATSVS